MNLAIAILTSAAIVLGSPFMGQLQSLLRRSLSTQVYVWLFGIGVLVAVAAAVGYAVAQIRERRARRLALIGAAAAVGGGYMWLTATPYPDVNAVERVHFVEYGVIALLFYRVWRTNGDLSIVVLPLLAAFMVGTLDEWLQWFIPVRVGEAHDVLLNLTSIVCGLMFAIALQPPESFSIRPHAGTLRTLSMMSALAWMVFAVFVSQVHLGYEHQLDGVGRFRSHYTVDQLIALQKHRRDAWDANPPRTLRRLSQEDQYLDEGLWHIRRRNLAEPFEAWHENLILERYFAPVLDIPTYAAPQPNRWRVEQRQHVESSVKGMDQAFVSAAEPYPVVTWRRPFFWAVVVAVSVACLATPMFADRHRNVERRH